jgi:uncharacterized protein involved in high-affinity Fe2+ transport
VTALIAKPFIYRHTFPDFLCGLCSRGGVLRRMPEDGLNQRREHYMKKKILAAVLAGTMVFGAFPAMADDTGAGFVENEIFSDEELDFINLSAVWFQAVPMENETISYSAEDADIHIEADISALENDLGYPVGEWVPYLTVDYKIDDQDGNEVVSGTFMEMAASDGPHYGNNIKLDPGTYDLTITIHSPGENGYLIHSDAETGPCGSLKDHFADGTLSYTFEGWEFAGLE